MTIREMTTDDCKDVAFIENSSFSMPWSLSAFENETKNSNAVYFIAEDGGRIAGYIGVHNVIDEGEITTFAVDKAFREKGYGKKLLEYLLDFEKKQNIIKIFLEVRENNVAARNLYEKTGFVVYGKRDNYYSDPLENAVLMVKNL